MALNFNKIKFQLPSSSPSSSSDNTIHHYSNSMSSSSLLVTNQKNTIQSKSLVIKRLAINNIYKLLDNKNIYNYVILQKYCIISLDKINNITSSRTSMSMEEENIARNISDNNLIDRNKPIVNICLINIENEYVVPNGYELIEKSPAGNPTIIYSANGIKYGLCYKRQTSAEERPISDIQIIYNEAVPPFGYTFLSPELLNDLPEDKNDDPSIKKPKSIQIAYTFTGESLLRQLTLIDSSQGEKAPPTYTCFNTTLGGYVANLNLRNYSVLLLCYSRDYTNYVIDRADLEPSDLRFVTPLLIALQTQDPKIACDGLELLLSLINIQFFSKKCNIMIGQNQVVVRHSEGLPYVALALAASNCFFDQNYQNLLLEVVTTLFHRHFGTLTLEHSVDLLLSSYLYLLSDNRELQLQEFCKVGVAYLMKGKQHDLQLEKENNRDNKSNVEILTSEVLQKMVDDVTKAAEMQSLFELWSNYKVTNPLFKRSCISIVHQLCVTDSEKKVCLLLLILCKFIDDGDSRYLLESISLIQYVLKQLLAAAAELNTQIFMGNNLSKDGFDVDQLQMTNSYHLLNKLSPAAAFILRKFLLPTISRFLAPYVHESIFSASLEILGHLWNNFRYDCWFEIGSCFNILIQYLHNPVATIHRRTTVVSFCSDITQSSTTGLQLVEMWRNFDYSTPFNIVRDIIIGLCLILKEKIGASPFNDGALDVGNLSLHMACIRSNSHEFDYVEDTSNTAPSTSQSTAKPSHISSNFSILRRSALSLLLCLITDLKLFTAVESINTGRKSVGKPSYHYLELLSDTSNTNKNSWNNILDNFQDLSKGTSHGSVKEVSKVFNEFKTENYNNKISFETHLNHAVNLAKQKTIQKAIDYLIVNKMLKKTSDDIASFIFTYIHRFELEAVGDFLGGTRPKEEKPFENEVRLKFLRKLKFRGLPVHEAMRLLLTNSGFRLPPEAQKIDRILESFGEVYNEIDVSLSSEATYVLSNAILMLNTSLHNPLIKEKDRISSSQFENMVTHIDGCPLNSSSIQEIYGSIAGSQFKIDLPTAASVIAAKEETTAAQLSPEEIHRSNVTSFEKHMNNIVRYSRILSWNHSYTSKHWNMVPTGLSGVDGRELMRPLFTAIFPDVASSIFTNIDCLMKSELSVVGNCIDGVKSLLSLSCNLSLWEERECILDYLSRFSLIVQEKLTPVELEKELLKKSYLQTDWRKKLSRMLHGRVALALPLINLHTDYFEKLVKRIRALYTAQVNKHLIEYVYNRVSNFINILATDRMVLAENITCKLNSQSTIQPYTFIVMSDILMYGSKNGDQLKVHRVLQLALCKIEDIYTAKDNSLDLNNAFRIVNPQKTITLVCHDSSDKNNWKGMIQAGIDMAKALRGHLVAQAEVQQMPADFVNRLKTTAAFVGKSYHSIRDGKVYPTEDSTCVQCLKKYTLFNRKNECGNCLESYCGECVSESGEVNGKRVSICRCCSGSFDNKSKKIESSNQ